MEANKYWKGLEELNQEAEFTELSQKEFAEEIPVEEIISETLTRKSSGRRDFLKLMGFSVTAATIASCRIPVKKVIPYAIKPEEIIPGVNNYYASTFMDGNEYCSILVKVRDGRPIKIEGNPQSPVTHGGTNARVQASVLSLYDKRRQRNPRKGNTQITWEQLDGEVKEQLGRVKSAGGNIRLLSSTIISPSTRAVIDDFTKAYPTATHVVYEPVSYSAIADAHATTFGKRAIPTYQFGNAEVIVGFSCDFLGTWVSPIQFAKEYIKNRKVDKDNRRMSRHIHFDSGMNMTAANADKRIALSPSEEKKAIAALYSRIVGGGASVSLDNKKVAAAVEATAQELIASKGKSLVVCGTNDYNSQLLIAAINQALGSYGSTIDISRPSTAGQANDRAVMSLLKEMQDGQVSALIIYNCNPAYSIPGFGDAMNKVAFSIAINDRWDETASKCLYTAPKHHYLESWDDAEPRVGSYSLAQPTISPLFNTRQPQDNLLIWSGATMNYEQYLQNRWGSVYKGNAAGTAQDFWINSLRTGNYEGSVSGEAGGAPSGTLSADVSAAASTLSSANGGGLELVLYEKVGIGNGKNANNPWLQELPDPITKATWDNYAMVPVRYAADNGITTGDVISVKAGNYSVDLPAIVQPGLSNKTIAIALGYGRTLSGPAGDNVGKNAYPFVTFDGRSFQYATGNVSVAKTGEWIQMAQTQTHHTIEGRDIVKETTLTEYKANTLAGNESRVKNEAILKTTLYPRHDYNTLRWFMSIDLNSCIGCGACAIACHAENNVPVVGRTEVARVHEMHWMRIDRYYSFAKADSTKLRDRITKEKEYDPESGATQVNDYEDVNVVFQPMLCQHCEHAPCENVCPVNATNHSTEGINQMAYNRCVGTRYCANNCPYKVRRFNWLDYTTADSFPWNTAEGAKQIGMLDSLTRMVLNPDVTVRSRGVMEKCTFCVQRMQETKLLAKKEERTIRDGEAVTACAQACPTDAIVFGNIHDPESRIRKANDDDRTYYVLNEIHTMPSIGYKTKVRNVDDNQSA